MARYGFLPGDGRKIGIQENEFPIGTTSQDIGRKADANSGQILRSSMSGRVRQEQEQEHCSC